MVTELNQVRLGNHVTIRTGKLDANASSTDGKYPFFTCSKTPLRITSYSYDCECVLVAGNGDLNVKYYNGKFDAYQRTYIIESIDKRQLDVRYLFHFLDVYVYVLRSQSIGGVIKYIKLGNLTEAQIPLPPLSEQKRIAGVLDKICEMKRNVEARLQKLDLLVKSRFNEMFGDVVNNDKHWQCKRLHEVATLLNGRAYSQNELLHSGKYPVLRVGNFFSTKDWYFSNLELDESKYCDTGDLLFAWSASFGPKIWDGGKVIYHYHIWKILLTEKLDRAYAYGWLNTLSEKIKKESHGITMVHTTKGSMEQRIIPLPPLPLQREFAAFVEKVEEMKATVRKELEKVDHLYRAKLQEYFG